MTSIANPSSDSAPKELVTGFTRCNVCDEPGTFTDATDRGVVQCNVREFRDESFTLWRCASCDSLHCLEEVDLPRYYENYPVKRQALTYFTRTAYANYLRRLRSVGMRRDHSVLDFGCGKGILVKFLRRKGFRNVSGFDAYSKKFSNPSSLARNYDVVIAQDVIEHVPDPRQTLAELVGMLRPGGLLCLGTPDAGQMALEGEKFYLHSLHVPYHRHILSRRALIALAAKLGCRPVAIWDRFYADTLSPMVNYRYMLKFLRARGDDADAAFEWPSPLKLFYPLSLIFYALFGYFFPPRSELTVVFKIP